MAQTTAPKLEFGQFVSARAIAYPALLSRHETP